MTSNDVAPDVGAAGRRTGDAIRISGDYQHRARTDGPAAQRYWHWEKERMVRKFSAPRPGDLAIDVGCGSGVVADLLASMGAETVGVDGNAEAIDYARKTFARDGLRFDLGLVDELDYAPSTFDRAYCFELIEHIYLHQVHDLLRTLHRIVKPGGSLTLTTPNYRGIWPALEWVLDTLRLVPHLEGEQHVTRFHRRSLVRALEQAGWVVERATTFSTFAPFVATISWRLASRVSELEDALRLPFGNILFVTARRP